MMPWLVISLVVFMLALYHAVLLEGWRARIALSEVSPNDLSDTSTGAMITVVVPARNAADTLPLLLQDLHAQRYSKAFFEVLVVDDHSTDGTEGIVNAMQRGWPQLRYVALTEGSGKKNAITQGVMEAQGEWIVLTDADARCGTGRISLLAEYWRSGSSRMVLLPVFTVRGNGFLSMLQYHEQLVFQGATAGSALEGRPMLANGANLAFDRKAFFEVGGFHGDRWASGDDMFLLKRMLRSGKPVTYLRNPSVTVVVEPERTVQGFVAQRLRWAGKMRAYRDLTGSIAALFVVMFPWLLLWLTVLVVRIVTVGEAMLYTWSVLCAAWLLWGIPIVRLSKTMVLFFDTVADDDAPRSPAWVHSTEVLLSLVAFTIYAPVFSIVAIFVRPLWKGRRI